MITNSVGTIQNEYDYLPYGGERDYSTSLANQNYKFIGKEAGWPTLVSSISGRDYD